MAKINELEIKAWDILNKSVDPHALQLNAPRTPAPQVALEPREPVTSGVHVLDHHDRLISAAQPPIDLKNPMHPLNFGPTTCCTTLTALLSLMRTNDPGEHFEPWRTDRSYDFPTNDMDQKLASILIDYIMMGKIEEFLLITLGLDLQTKWMNHLMAREFWLFGQENGPFFAEIQPENMTITQLQNEAIGFLAKNKWSATLYIDKSDGQMPPIIVLDIATYSYYYQEIKKAGKLTIQAIVEIITKHYLNLSPRQGLVIIISMGKDLSRSKYKDKKCGWLVINGWGYYDQDWWKVDESTQKAFILHAKIVSSLQDIGWQIKHARNGYALAQHRDSEKSNEPHILKMSALMNFLNSLGFVATNIAP